MRAVIQRVSSANITINADENKKISYGLVVFIAIEDSDDDTDIFCLVYKIVNMRIFDNELGIMDISLLDTSSDIMIVSQFTLYASTRKGNRPSYLKSSKPEVAIPLYNKFIAEVRKVIGLHTNIVTGIFGADMKVDLINDGPVTIIIDTKNRE